MSKVVSALNFLKEDNEKAKDQWLKGEQFRSLLQREEKELKDLLDLFDPTPDDEAWKEEYYKAGSESPKLEKLRKRIAFLRAARKEFHEDYDHELTDVDFMRLLEVPFTDPQYVIDWSILELGGENAS